MSAPPTRNRTAAGAPKIAAAQKTSPNPIPGVKNPVSGRDNNPRLRTQKPEIRPVPRLDKAAAAVSGGNNGRLRWSASSMPRGRSSSPSELIRVFRDVKVSDARVVSSGGKKSGNRSVKDGKLGLGLEKKIRFCERGELKSEEQKKNFNGFRALSIPSSSSSSIKSNGDDSVGELKIAPKFSKDRLGVSSAEKSGFCRTKVKNLQNSKERDNVKEGTGSRNCVKYPRNLHEKLAFLEGKVKRIASDIKKTKEMLDLNNPDESKVILSDIQDKISGIELAIGNVVGDTSKVAESGCGEKKEAEKSKNERLDQVKSLVNGLNDEELEERLFPHHKLLKNRSSLNVPHVPEITSKSGVKENPIANNGFESNEVKETESGATSGKQDTSTNINPMNQEIVLTADETLEDFDEPENSHKVRIDEEIEDARVYQVKDIGTRSTTGGWFVSEGESALLAHADGSCSFYDIANCEEKAVYSPPMGLSPNIWRDCWIIRATGSDGCSGKYVVAASAGNILDSGFCSWDFYTKKVQAFHMEDGEIPPSRTVLAPLSTNTTYRRNVSCNEITPENRQWWYKPSGPLIISTASCQRVVKMFDIRDGERIMRWELQKPVAAMDNSSPLQWRNRGKVVIAESEKISVWDVNSITQQSLLSICLSGRNISALHVVNTDAELGGGVRQRVTSAEAEGNDGVFCTPDAINVFDFRHPSGIGLKIPKLGITAHSVFTRGDSIYIGCTNTRPTGKKHPSTEIQHFSLKKQRMVSTYAMPESNAHSHCSAITQVWGNSELVMGVSGLGLFVFDALNNTEMQCFGGDYGCVGNVKEVVGSDDLYSPSFDYTASRVLLLSRDRPAIWRHLL